MLEKVLAIRGAVFHASDETDELHAHAVDAEVDACPLAGLEDLVLELFLDLCDHFLDACGMDAAVDDELMKRESCDLPANGIECGKQDGVRGVVHDDFNPGGSLQGADVASLTADDAALDLIVLDGEGRHCVLDGRLSGGALYGIDNDTLGFLGGIEPRLVHGVVDIGLGLRARLGLHVLHEDVLGLGGAHAGNGFKLAVDLRDEAVVLLAFLVYILGAGLKALLE